MSGRNAVPGSLADRGELNAILSRAVTCSRIYESDSLDDDLRMIARLGARFLGRAAYAWLVPDDEEAHFTEVDTLTRRVHTEIDDGIVVQACLFEAIYPGISRIPVPEWVFRDLDEPVEARCFDYEAMVGAVRPPNQGLGSPWAGGAAPDLSLDETLRWFYYRAGRYMDVGCEALHIGQIHLIAGADRGYRAAERLIEAIRRRAAGHARRGWVILDAHSHGIARNGRLFFDFTSRPLSARAVRSYPEGIALVRRGTRLGGRHPGGWMCDDAPVLLEVDNWHGYSLEPDPALWLDGDRRAEAGRWGWDDINWFSYQTPDLRRDFLRYADSWARLQGAEWHFQPPIRRPLGRAAIRRPDGPIIPYYRANESGPACPDGFGDEAAIASLWSAARSFEPETATPSASEPPRSPSGVDIAEPVALVGEIQEHIGGIPGDASCPWSTLRHIGEGRFARRYAFPVAADLRCTVTVGGTGTDPTNEDGISGSPPYTVRVTRPGQVLEFVFDWETRRLAVRDVESGKSALISASRAVPARERRRAGAVAIPDPLPTDWF